MNNSNQPQPCTVYGMIFNIDEKTTKTGKTYQLIRIGLYNGKNQNGEYNPSTVVSVKYFGNKKFELRQKASFSGMLAITTAIKEDKTYINADLTCFEPKEEASDVALPF